MKLPEITKDEVFERLAFGEKRLNELLNLNGGDLAGADASFRQQLLQEFFFHVVGAIEVLAQLVNQDRVLKLVSEDVSMAEVARKLPDQDQLKQKLLALYTKTKKTPLPQNPYSYEGYIFRLYNYRHQVTHRRRNQYFIFVDLKSSNTSRECRLPLDPRDPNRGPSNQSVNVELTYILDLVKSRCHEILALL